MPILRAFHMIYKDEIVLSWFQYFGSTRYGSFLSIIKAPLNHSVGKAAVEVKMTLPSSGILIQDIKVNSSKVVCLA